MDVFINALRYLKRKPQQPYLVSLWVLYPGRIGICGCCFFWREKTCSSQGKALGVRRAPTTNSAHIMHRPELNPGALWKGEFSNHDIMLAPFHGVKRVPCNRKHAKIPGKNLRSSRGCNCLTSSFVILLIFHLSNMSWYLFLVTMSMS